MQIQRWQSLLLLVAAVMMGCFTFMSLGQVQLPNYSLDFTTLGFSVVGKSTDGAPTGFILRTWAFFIVSLMSVIIPAVNIFLYNNLKLQKTLCLVELLFILTACGVGCIYGYNQFEDANVSWSSLIIAPVLAFIADWLAWKRIRHDERLLRSADRLR